MRNYRIFAFDFYPYTVEARLYGDSYKGVIPQFITPFLVKATLFNIVDHLVMPNEIRSFEFSNALTEISDRKCHSR